MREHREAANAAGMPLFERVARFLQRAEESGELRAIEERAEATRDAKRKELCAELVAFTPQALERASKAAMAEKARTAEALRSAERILLAAREADYAAQARILAAEAPQREREAAIRAELGELAPEIARDTLRALDALRENVRRKLDFWPLDGWPRYGSNQDDVTRAGDALQRLMDAISRLPYEPVTFAEIEARCRAALREGREISAKLLDRNEQTQITAPFTADHGRALAA
ncbi:MAG TPA: hypothetical protein VFJ25_12345 [Casimicrobiaceae bacterium]|nr:hypothetical protein [Casimicrobiaceae bacterium]